MFPRLTALRTQFTELRNGAELIQRTANAANRELTDAEKADADALLDRAEALRPDIERLAAQHESLAATSAILDRIGATAPGQLLDRTQPREAAKLTAGEYFAALFAMQAGDTTEAEFLDRTARYIDRATQTTADSLGLLPIPIIGDVIKLADSRRPVFLSMSQRPMPAQGRKFDRPRISQRAQVGEQAAELDVLSSRKMIVTFDEVTKRTVGGTLELSNQDIEWTDPAALDLLVTDFADLYAEFTESIACTALIALAATTSPYVPTTVATIVDSYVDGVVAAYNLSKRTPDTVWLDLASWATLASTTTASENRSALAVLRETLSELGTPVRFVVGPQLGADTRIVGTSTLTEAYEKQNGLLRGLKVSNLAQEVAYSGYVAFYGRAEFGVKLVAA